MLLSLVFDAARLRTLWLQGYNNTLAAVSTVTLVIKFLLLALEAVGKQNYLRTEWRSQSPEAKSGLFGKSLFLWLNRLFRTGFARSLSVDDLLPLDKHLTSDYLYDRLHQPWTDRAKSAPRSLLKLFFRRLQWRLLAAVPARLALIGFNFCQPFLIQRAIDFNNQPVNKSTTNVGYGLIGAYFLVYCGIAVTTGQYQHLTYRAITMARGGLVSMMFDKTSSVKADAADPASSLTLMSADIERITNGWTTMHEVWANPIEVGLAIYLLERQLGAACAIPIAVAIGKLEPSARSTKEAAKPLADRTFSRSIFPGFHLCYEPGDSATSSLARGNRKADQCDCDNARLHEAGQNVRIDRYAIREPAWLAHPRVENLQKVQEATDRDHVLRLHYSGHRPGSDFHRLRRSCAQER